MSERERERARASDSEAERVREIESDAAEIWACREASHTACI